MSNVKVGNSWKTCSTVYIKVNGVWKIVGNSYANVGGTWKLTTFGSPPPAPTMQYSSTGVFRISNYNSTLIYEATLAAGSGAATFNASNGTYTLSGENSGFNVIARYAAGALPSAAGYMERKKYEYSCRDVSYTERVCDCYLDASGYCTDVYGNCQPGHTPSWGQWGCSGPMCWVYYNGVKCDRNCRDETRCCRSVCDVLVDQSPNGYTNSGSEWYKAR